MSRLGDFKEISKMGDQEHSGDAIETASEPPVRASCVAAGVLSNLAADEFLALTLLTDKARWLTGNGSGLLFGSDEVLAASVPVEALECAHGWGIYFLIWRGRICYVGQAVNIRLRLRQHLEEGRPIERVAVIIRPARGLLTEIEHAYIGAWRPPWNAETLRRGSLDSLPDFMAAAEALDRSCVGQWYCPMLGPEDHGLPQWRQHMIGYDQALAAIPN